MSIKRHFLLITMGWKWAYPYFLLHNFVFMWYFSNLHSKHLFLNPYCVETKVHKANSFLIINFKWYILHVFLSMGNLKKGQCAVIYFETFSPPGFFLVLLFITQTPLHNYYFWTFCHFVYLIVSFNFIVYNINEDSFR